MPIRWWADKREWGTMCGTREAEITSVTILDGYGRKRANFQVGDKIIMRAEFDVREEVKEPHFGIALFRNDYVYCYGPNSLFDGHRIKKLRKGKGWFSIEFKKLLLMPGEYRISVGIWDKKEILPYCFHIASYKFRIMGANKNNQLLFIIHKWNNDKLVNSRAVKESNSNNLKFLKDWVQHKSSLKNSNINIDSIQLLDSEGNIRNSFKTNETMGIKIGIVGNVCHNLLIWIGIFRADGIYCHSALRNLSKNKNKFTLIYPKLRLLPGEYYLSVCIWKKNQKQPLFYKHKASVFKVSFLGKDHGTVYLDHSWKWKLP